MPDIATTRQVLSLDPDGLPVSLVDIAGDTLDGTLWGAVRAGGAVALVVTERDYFDRSNGPTGPPTAGQLRALADALDDDPNGPQPTPGSRRWEKERADKLAQHVESQRGHAEQLLDRVAEAQASRDAAWDAASSQRTRADQLAADVETMQQSVRDYAEEAELAQASERLAQQLGAGWHQRAEVAERKLLTLKHGDGAIKLVRAAVQYEERERAAVLVGLATRAGNSRAIRAATSAALAGLAAGLLIGRNR